MGLSITIPGADFSGLVLDSDAEAWLNASGITNLDTIDSVNKAVKAMKSCGSWTKTDFLYFALEDIYDKVKRNVKNPAGTVIPSFTNTLNKGFVLTGVGTTPGPRITLPITNIDTAAMAANGGHSLYFMNEPIAASNPSGTTGVISNTESDTQVKSMSYSAQGSASPVKKLMTLNGKVFVSTPAFTSKGSFGFTVDSSSNVKFWGNGTVLASGAATGTATIGASNITIGVATLYPVNNTISAFSLGKTAMTDAEMQGHMNAINTLIAEVHGITI